VVLKLLISLNYLENPTVLGRVVDSHSLHAFDALDPIMVAGWKAGKVAVDSRSLALISGLLFKWALHQAFLLADYLCSLI
jgi:hypothetical protein